MKKSLILLSYDYPPNDGGISRLTAAFATELAAKNIHIELCTLKAESRGQGLARPNLPTVELSRTKGKREIGLLRYLISKSKQDQFITTVWNPEGTLAWLLGHHNLYILAHGNEVMPYPTTRKYLLKSILRKKVLLSARCVICNSHYTEQLVKDIDTKIKTTVVNPGVDYERFNTSITKLQACQELGLATDKRILLSVSRVDEYKGHDVVLNALASLPKIELEQVQYVVAGKGRHLDTLKQLAVELGVSENITWLGFVNDEQLPKLYKAADLFSLCTREDKQQRGVEGFGMVFLEAQASGLPVIGTDAGGISDAISHGEGGWLIDQDDSQELMGYIKKLINSPDIISEQGKLGSKRIHNSCTWRHYTNDLLTILEKY